MSEFERWESRFSAPGYLFGTAPNAFLASQAHRLEAGQKALTLADGEGRNGVWLAEQGLDVLAVDFSPTALQKARALAAERGVTLRAIEADLAQWSWPTDAFDVIAAIFIQFAGPDVRSKIFAGIKQALKPGGWLLMQGYRPEQLTYRTGGPGQVENLYTRAILQEAFADMSSPEITPHGDLIPRGPRPNRTAGPNDPVGRK